MTDCSPRLSRRLRGTLAAAGLTLALFSMAAPASATDRLALGILAFVHSIDTSPDWSAQMRGLAVDEERATATIGSLVVAAEDGAVILDIADLTLTGYAGAEGGGFAASSLEIGSATIATRGANALLTDVRFSDVGVPALAGFAYDKSKPFTSLIGAYAAIAKSRVSGGRIAEIGIRETFEGETSLITYRNVDLGPLADGRLEHANAAPLTVQSPTTDPLAELLIGRAEARGIDLDAFLHVADPLRYVAGTGDGKWREAVGFARYSDLTMKVPGIKLTIASIAAEGLRVRQPEESFVPLLDAAMSDRKRTPLAMRMLRSRYLGGLLSAFGAARFSVDDIAIAAGGIDQLTLGGFALEDASSDGIGEIAIEDFVAAIAGQGAVQVGRFALEEVVPPLFETVDTALDRARRGANVDLSSLAPKVGSLEAADIYLRAIDFPGFAVDRLHADLANHIGTVPTAIAVKIDGLDVATESLPGTSMRTLVAGLGYDRLAADATFNLAWRESDGTMSLDDFQLDIDDFGNATADLVLAGLTRAAIEGSDNGTLLADAKLERARLTFEDRSVVERSLSMRADLLGIPLDRLKQQLAGALPLMLAFVGDAEKIREIVPVLQTFIRTPGTLTIEASPETPVPLADLETAVRTRPQSLPGLLAISVSGTPGGEGERAGDERPAEIDRQGVDQ
jgi:hypothetical protein